MPQNTFVLVLEPEDAERKKIALALREDNFQVMTAATAKEARAHIHEHSPDIVLMGLILPDAKGLDFMQEIHRTSDAKVIIVTSKDSLTDKIIGLELGADDYVTKPYEMGELIARVHARFRRHKQVKRYLKEIQSLQKNSNTEEPMKLQFGEWILDRSQWQAYDRKGCSANLTPREFRILEALILEGNKVLSRNQFLEKAWHGENNTTDRAVDIQILRIRKKINDNTEHNPIIRSVRGIGYQLVPKVIAIQ